MQIENGILKHLSTFGSEFEKYFPEITIDELDFVRNSVLFSVEKLSDESQDEFLELVNDSSARQAYCEKLLTQFWIEMKDSYSKTTEKTLRILIPYTGFSKSHHLFLNCYYIKNIFPIIMKLVHNKQYTLKFCFTTPF